MLVGKTVVKHEGLYPLPSKCKVFDSGMIYPDHSAFPVYYVTNTNELPNDVHQTRKFVAVVREGYALPHTYDGVTYDFEPDVRFLGSFKNSDISDRRCFVFEVVTIYKYPLV